MEGMQDLPSLQHTLSHHHCTHTQTSPFPDRSFMLEVYKTYYWHALVCASLICLMMVR